MKIPSFSNFAIVASLRDIIIKIAQRRKKCKEKNTLLYPDFKLLFIPASS